MKKTFIALSGLLAASVVLAHAPVVTIDPIGPLEFATFPQAYDVTGTVAHSGNGNVSAVSELKLFINDVQEGVTVNPNYGNDPSAAFSLPWNITGPGTYNVKVTAKHGGSTGEDSEEVVVSETEVYVGVCPAAPAIAGEYLRSKGVKSGSAAWKKAITAVAGETGSNGSLWAANACNPGYADLVKAFVDSL